MDGHQGAGATLAFRDPHNRGLMWMHDTRDGPAWEPVVFERYGNRSLGRYTDADRALRALRALMDCPSDIDLPDGWTWERVVAERARWGMGPEMVPEVTVPGACTAWGHVNFARRHQRQQEAA